MAVRVLHVDGLAGPLRAFVRAGLEPLGASELVTVDPREPLCSPRGFDAVVVTGSEAGVNDPLPWIAPLALWIRAIPEDMPFFGVCFGHQILAHAFGAPVVSQPPPRRGVVTVRIEDPRLGAVGDARVVVSHQDQVAALPEGFVRMATSDYAPIQAMRHAHRPWWSVQFHPDFGRDALRADQASGQTAWSAWTDDELDAARSDGVLRRFAVMMR
jgi:GMP synthase-like glutamine amidotransferase